MQLVPQRLPDPLDPSQIPRLRPGNDIARKGHHRLRPRAICPDLERIFPLQLH